MPAFAAHYLFARSVLEGGIPEGLGGIVRKYPQAFFWGAQGPDIFLYFSPVARSRSVNRISQTLHAGDADGLLSSMAAYARKPGSPASCTAYLAGYLCHYCLDSAAHPYVFFLEKKLEGEFPKAGPSARHAYIESQIDTLLCGRLLKGGVRAFPVREAASFSPGVISELYGMYGEVLPLFTDFVPARRQFEKCFRDAKRFLILLFSGKSRVRVLAGLLETVLGRPFLFSAHIRPDKADERWLNERHEPWRNLRKPGEALTLSFPELFDSALKSASVLSGALDEALKTGRGPVFHIRETFDNGNYRE